MNRSHTRFRVSPSAYYPRFFDSKPAGQESKVLSNSRKRKRKEKKKKKPHALNEREKIADQRHQEARPLLLKAHECLMRETDLLEVMSNLRRDFDSSRGCGDSFSREQSFVELRLVWQSPLYEITLNFDQCEKPNADGGSPIMQYSEQRVLTIFDNLVLNETSDDVEAEFLNSRYVIPRESSFYMCPSEVKVKADGSMINDLDLFHHRPYEWLLLGQCHREAMDSKCLSKSKPVQDNQIIISIPGDYSRKAPVGGWLMDYVPGFKPARCIELCAREMISGCTSWRNEPLHFQELNYFIRD